MSSAVIARTLAQLIRNNQRLAILTGAGISTDSGIPDYRGPNGTYTIQKDYKPITYQEFMGTDLSRRRYWARSYLGYPWFTAAKPNPSHTYIAHLQRHFPDILPHGSILTQNVDSLHIQAGAQGVVEMHGALRNVVCMSCGNLFDRALFQQYLSDLNPTWRHRYAQQIEKVSNIEKVNRDDEEEGDVLHTLGVSRKNRMEKIRRPDGDLDLGSLDFSRFRYPSCRDIGMCSSTDSILKPNVTFFGENMTQAVRDASFDAVDECSAMLVVGSSLEVFSAYRLVKRVSAAGKPIMILNLGPTRADNLPHVQQFNEPCTPVLKEIFSILTNEISV